MRTPLCSSRLAPLFIRGQRCTGKEIVPRTLIVNKCGCFDNISWIGTRRTISNSLAAKDQVVEDKTRSVYKLHSKDQAQQKPFKETKIANNIESEESQLLERFSALSLFTEKELGHNINSLDVVTAKDEAQRLWKEVEIVVEQMKQSKFYDKLSKQIKSAEFQRQLKQVLGSHSDLKMVIYALGSLEYAFNSQYQLAIALLLKQDFASWIGGIEVYDPRFTLADVIVLKELGCEVLFINEECKRKVEKPTLFYMPFSDSNLVGNLLWANWTPPQINQLIILTWRFKSKFWIRRFANRKFNGVSEDYMSAIQKHTKEILFEGGYGDRFDGIFYNFAWHFFKVDSQLDMDTLFPDNGGTLSEKRRLELESTPEKIEPYNFLFYQDLGSSCNVFREETFMKPFAKGACASEDYWSHYYGRYRGPRKYRCCSNPPPRGWIKLNIGGISSNNGDNLGGFGGICHNNSKIPLLIYKGALGEVDETTACIKALRFGLLMLLKMPRNTGKKLIVESSNLWVIQLLNRCLEPQEEILESLNEVRILLRKFNFAAYHIYEEANLVADYLAKRGAVSGNHVYLLGEYSNFPEGV